MFQVLLFVQNDLLFCCILRITQKRKAYVFPNLLAKSRRRHFFVLVLVPLEIFPKYRSHLKYTQLQTCLESSFFYYWPFRAPAYRNCNWATTSALPWSVIGPIRYATFIWTVRGRILQIEPARTESAALARCVDDCTYHMSPRITVSWVYVLLLSLLVNFRWWYIIMAFTNDAAAKTQTVSLKTATCVWRNRFSLVPAPIKPPVSQQHSRVPFLFTSRSWGNKYQSSVQL